MVTGLSVIGKVAISDHNNRFGGPLLSRAVRSSALPRARWTVTSANLSLDLVSRNVATNGERCLCPHRQGQRLSSKHVLRSRP